HRQAGEVVEAADVAGLGACLRELRAVEGGAFVAAGDLPPQELLLSRAELVAVDRLELRLVVRLRAQRPGARIAARGAMDVGLTMSTHGLLRRDERDFFLQKLEPSEMRPVELAQLAERLGYHSVWFSDHVCMGRDLSAQHTANESGTRAYPDRPV